MILEEATKEAFGYYSTELMCRSNKPILATCELCGKIRLPRKSSYYTFCNSCSVFLGKKLKGNKDKIKCICLTCNKIFYVNSYIIKNGKGKYCSKKCYGIAQRGKKSLLWRGGRKVSIAKSNAKRDRELGYTLLIPPDAGEVGHHLTNEHVIGIQKEVHERFANPSREKHRTLILQRLKANDKKKYEIVLCILANSHNPFSLQSEQNRKAYIPLIS